MNTNLSRTEQARLLRELPLRGGFLGLAGLHRARRDLPVERARDVPVLPHEHHGVGVEKRAYLPAMFSAEEIDCMARLRASISRTTCSRSWML